MGLMGFRFTVTQTWQDERLGVYHLIGRLEEGAILPNSHAVVAHSPKLDVQFGVPGPLPGRKACPQ